MKVKKVFRIIGRILLVLLLMIILFLLTTTIVYHIKLNKIEKQLKADGYYNPVSTGEHSLNVYTCGNGNGNHTVVFLSGFFDGEMYIGWRQMTAGIEKDNRIVFADRAGYGLSDDTDMEMTAENVVEDYRTALKNAGIKAPYILAGHSMGGLYAAYWESKYPDETEAVIFIDGESPVPDPDEEYEETARWARLYNISEKLGLTTFLARHEYSELLSNLSKDEIEKSIYLLCKTSGSKAARSEAELLKENECATWDSLVTNEVPKIYINASLAYTSREELEADGITAEIISEGFDNGGSDDELFGEVLEFYEEAREETLYPFIERLGNCECIDLHGNHVIFLDKPDECSRIVKSFIDSLSDS